jgi:hypothetical protein
LFKKIVFIDGDNSKSAAPSLLNIPPPPSDVLVILFRQLSQYDRDSEFWSGHNYVIVRSSRSDNKNSADVSMIFVASILTCRLLPLVDANVVSLEFVLVSDDTFISDLKEEIRDLGMPCIAISGYYVDLGLYLARRMGYSREKVENSPVILTANKISQHVSPNNPIKNVADFSKLIDQLGLGQELGPGQAKQSFIIGELTRRGLFQFTDE